MRFLPLFLVIFQFVAIASPHPYARATLKTQPLLKIIQEKMGDTSTTESLLVLGTLHGLGDARLTLDLFGTPEQPFLPRLELVGDLKPLHSLFATGGMFSSFVEASGTNTYRLSSSSLNSMKKRRGQPDPKDLGVGDWILNFKGTHATLVASSNLESLIQDEEKSVLFSQHPAKFKNDQTWFRVTVLLPEEISEEAPDLTSSPILKGMGPMNQLIQNQFKSMWQLTKPFKDISSISFKTSTFNEEQRAVEVTLSSQEKEPLREKLKAWTDNNNIVLREQGKAPFQLQLLPAPLIGLKLDWKKAEDAKVGKSLQAILSREMMSMMMSARMVPTEGPVQERVQHLMPSPNAKGLPKTHEKLSELIKEFIYPSHSWNQNDHLVPSCVLGPMVFPGSHLTKVKGRITAIHLNDGTVVTTEEDSSWRVGQNSALQGTHLRALIPKTINKENITEMDVEVELNLPEEIHSITFSPKDPVGLKKTSGPITFTLDRMERDLVMISCHPPRSIELLARNTKGQALHLTMSTGGAGQKRQKFAGIPDSVEAMVVNSGNRMFKFRVPYPKGNPSQPPTQPTESIARKFRQHVQHHFSSILPERLDAKFIQPHESNGRVGLGWKVSNGFLQGHAKWMVNAFGKNGPISFKGYPSTTTDGMLTYLGQAPEDEVLLWWGEVQLSSSANILGGEVLDGKEISFQLPNGEVHASIDRNALILKTPSSTSLRTLNTQAYDAEGLPLEQATSSSRTTNNRRTQHILFWGQVKRVDLQIQVGELKKTFPFELALGEVDPNLRKDYEARLKSEGEILKALSKANRALRYSGGANLCAADLRYALNSNGNPMGLLSEEMAQSDPKGAELYGYDVKPWNGYYITTSDGFLISDKTTPHQLRDETSLIITTKGSRKVDILAAQASIIAIPVDKKTAMLTFRYDDPVRVMKYEGFFPVSFNHSSDRPMWEPVPIKVDTSHNTESLFRYQPRLKADSYEGNSPQSNPPLLPSPPSRSVEQQISSSIFPSRLYPKRNYLSVDYDAGPFSVPSMARGQLTLKELVYQDDSIVQVVSEKATMPTHPSNLNRAYLRFGLQPQDSPDKLKALVFTANIHVPEGHHKITWDRDTPIGKAEGGEGIGLNLLRFEGRVLETVVHPPVELNYQGFDEKGKLIPLLYKNNTRLQHGIIFERAPVKIEILLPKAWNHHLFTMTIPFEGGQERKMPSEPSDQVPYRYQADSLSSYTPVSQTMVAKASPKWNAKRGTVDLPLGETRVSVNANWKLRGFSERELLKLDGYNSTHNNSPIFRLRNPDPSLRLIEGEVHLSSYGNIHKLDSLDPATHLDNAPLNLDRNHASITLPRTVNILDSLVLDPHGFPLKNSRRSSYNGETKTTTWVAWGQIGSVQAVIAKDSWTLKKNIHLELGDYNKEAIELLKKTASQRDDLFKALYYPDRMGHPIDDCPSAVWLLKHGISMEGKPLNLIDSEITTEGVEENEPTSVIRLGSYTISTLKGRIYRDEKRPFVLSEKLDFLTTEGRMAFGKYSEEPARVAIPDDPKLPTYIYYHGLYSTEQLESDYVPENYSKVWKRVSWNQPSISLPKAFISYLKKKPPVNISTRFTPPPFQSISEKEITSVLEKGFTVQKPYKTTSYLRSLYTLPMTLHSALSKDLKISFEALFDQEGNDILKRKQNYSISNTNLHYLYMYTKDKFPGNKIKYGVVNYQVTYPTKAIDETFPIGDLEKRVPNLRLIHQDDDSLEATHSFSSSPLVIGYHSSGNQLLPVSSSTRSGYFAVQFSGKIDRLRLVRGTSWKTAKGTKKLHAHDEKGQFIGNTVQHQYVNNIQFETEVPEESYNQNKVVWNPKSNGTTSHASFPYTGSVHAHYTWKTTTVYDDGKISNHSINGHQNGTQGISLYPRRRRNTEPVYLEGELLFGVSTNIRIIRFSPSPNPAKFDLNLPRPLSLHTEDETIVIKVPKLGHLTTSTYVDPQGFIMKHPPKKVISNKDNNPSEDFGYKYIVSPPIMPGELIIQFSELPTKKPIPFVFNLGKLSEEEMDALKEKSQTSQDITPLLKQIIKAYAPYHPYYETGLAERYYSLNGEKQASGLIPVEVAHSDPLGAQAFGYKAKPYLGYTFTIAKGWSKKGMPQPYKTTKPGSVKLKWEKGEVSTARHMVDPVVIAVPKNSKLPVYYLEKGSIYSKVGGPTEFIPVKGERAGWSKL